jgi:hypothetical protein
MTGKVPLADAAMKLGIGYHRARNMLFRKEIEGGRDRYGRLFVTTRELRRLLQEEQQSPHGTRRP